MQCITILITWGRVIEFIGGGTETENLFFNQLVGGWGVGMKTDILFSVAAGGGGGE